MLSLIKKNLKTPTFILFLTPTSSHSIDFQNVSNHLAALKPSVTPLSILCPKEIAKYKNKKFFFVKIDQHYKMLLRYEH